MPHAAGHMLALLTAAFFLSPSGCLGSDLPDHGSGELPSLACLVDCPLSGQLTSVDPGETVSLLQLQAKPQGQEAKQHSDWGSSRKLILEQTGADDRGSSGGHLNTSCRVSDWIDPACNCYMEEIAYSRDPWPVEYQEKSMWKPSPSETVFSIEAGSNYGPRYVFLDVYDSLPAAAFNPTIMELPRDVAQSLQANAHYLAVVRHRDDGCSRARTTWRMKGNKHSSVVVLDRSMKTVLIGTVPVPLEDYRLVAFKGKVLVTGNLLDGDNPDQAKKWSFRVFELTLRKAGVLDELPTCPATIVTEMKRFEHDGVSDFDNTHSVARFYGKNLGLVFPNTEHPGADGDELRLLWRLSNPVDIRKWTDPTLHLTSGGSSAHQGMRNNGNPIFLSEHNAYLAIGHMYWSSNDTKEPRRRYVHRFVMFNASPPHEWLRASQPFCFPAVSDLSKDLQPREPSRWCENIQFIMSWVLNGTDILITYGVNDCESSVAKLPLQAVINATSTDLELVLPRDDSDPTDGFWTGVDS